MADGEFLLAAGAICMLASGFMLHKLSPREGRALSAWTRSEARTGGTALLILMLFMTGGVMIARAFFGG